jgi:GNAT superfamily N-acetyltransferase
MYFELAPHFTVRELDQAEFGRLFTDQRCKMFPNTFDFQTLLTLNETQRALEKELAQLLNTRYTLRWGIEHNDVVVGWTFGFQVSSEDFYMCNSALHPEFRGRGLYSALLPKVIERTTTDGFQIVSSKHSASNNQVIIPKLKAGFRISGMEINDRFGTLVRLAYYSNPTRLEFFKVRTGEEKPSDEIMRYAR